MLILVVLVLWVVLVVLLSAWSLWFQAYIYSEPVGEIYWRGPAAGTAVTLLLCLWIVVDYRAPGRYRPLHEFSGRTETVYDTLTIPNDRGVEVVYHLEQTQRGKRYLFRGAEPKSRPDRIKVKDAITGEEHVFEPEKDAQGHYKTEPNRPLRYLREDKKEVMEEGYLGTVSTYHVGWLLVDLFLHVVLLAGTFVSLWLLLRFQWSHALGQAVVLWALLLLFVLPPVLTKAEDTARERATPQTTGIGAQRMCMMSPSCTT
jgi:hypothetical protein